MTNEIKTGIEKPQFQSIKEKSRAFLNDARDILESLKDKELTFSELQEELRKIITSLTAGISTGDINVGNKKEGLISLGSAFKNTKTLSEDDVRNYIRKLKENI